LLHIPLINEHNPQHQYEPDFYINVLVVTG
jgi:hypothetical protein